MPKGIRSIQISVGETKLTHFGGIVLIQRFCQKLRLKWHLQNQVRFSHRSSQYHPIELILAIIFALIAGIPRLTKTKKTSRQWFLSTSYWSQEFSLCLKLASFSETSESQNYSKHYQHSRLFATKNVSVLCSQNEFSFRSRLFCTYSLWQLYRRSRGGLQSRQKRKKVLSSLILFRSQFQGLLAQYVKAWEYRLFNRSSRIFRPLFKQTPSLYLSYQSKSRCWFLQFQTYPTSRGEKGWLCNCRQSHRSIKLTLEGLRYHRFRRDWAAAEFHYTPHNWKKPRRFIVIRRPLPEKDSDQLTLFTMKRYSYQVFVTNLPLQPENIWYFYRGRALIEKYIRELKENFALAKIPTNNFLANQFYFHLLLFAYDIINWFKRICLPPRFRNATLETIRTEFLVIPARLVKTGNKNTIKLPKEYIPEHLLKNIMQKIENMESV